MGLVLKTLEPVRCSVARAGADAIMCSFTNSLAVVQDEVLPEAIELASSMAAQGPIAVRSCVRSIRMKQDEGLDKALWREADAQSYCYASQVLVRNAGSSSCSRSHSLRVCCGTLCMLDRTSRMELTR